MNLPMRILIASSEVHPFSKTGGLADMVGALGKYLAQARQEVRILTPFYPGISERFSGLHKVDFPFALPLGNELVHANLWELKMSERCRLLFLDQPGFYQRKSLYQENGVDYPDNAERFIFFSKAVAHLARYFPWKPDIVHLHDWQAALAALFIHHEKQWVHWNEAPRTCLSIHNLAYQGNFPFYKYALTNLPYDYFTPRGIEFHHYMNCLKAGLVYADALTTVSPSYATEITTPAFGCGLDGVLRERQHSLDGILNGVDYDEWNTEENPFLPAAYDASDLEGKTICKRELQREMKLPQSETVPLFGAIARLVDQKGIDILLGALEEMLPTGMQFILLGSGDPAYETALNRLAQRRPQQAAVRIGYDHGLSHRIEAGCDFYLMPSRFEPCGLNQMYSLRYGAIPIVRATGGLEDSVIDLTQDLERANGIKFRHYSSGALSKAIRKALAIYQDPELLDHYRQNALEADFSWERTAAEYLQLFRKLTNLS
jgi:starch synthase